MAVSIDPDSNFLGVLDFIKEAGSGVHQNPWDNIRDKVGGLLYNTLVEPQEYQTPIFDTGQTQQFADTHNAMLPERGSKQSMLLPFGYDAQGNIEPAIPSLARDVGLGAFGLLGEYEKAQTGTGYGSLDDITPQEAANSMQGLLEVMTGGLIDNAPKSVRSGLSRGGEELFKDNWWHGSPTELEGGKFDLTRSGSNTGAKDARDVFYLSKGRHTAKEYLDEIDDLPSEVRAKYNDLKTKSEELRAKAFKDNKYAWKSPFWKQSSELSDEANRLYDSNVKNKTIGSMNEVKLTPKSPMIVDLKGEAWDEATQLQYIREAREIGHDAVVFKNMQDSGWFGGNGTDDVVAMFNPDAAEIVNSEVFYSGGKGVGTLNAGTKAARGLLDSTPEQARKARIAANRAEANALRFGDDFSYQQGHTSPSPDFGFNLSGYNIDDFMPDVLSPNGYQYYGMGQEGADEAIQIMRKMNSNPDGMVTVYRAVPKGASDTINQGDWVTTVRSYAEGHGRSVLNDDYDVLSKQVPAKEVWNNGDSVMEYGWHPEERKPIIKDEKKTKAGTKAATGLLDVDNIVTGAERDANFKNWFGDSKVVDEAGEPLTVYHGSADDIEAFNLGHPNRKDTGWLGEGVYTTDNAGTASTYSIMKAGTENPNVMPLNLSLKNPYYATIEEKHAISKRGKAGAKEFTEKLKEMGHDGVILKYGGDDAPNIGNREFVVFEPTQVKSIHNSGTYDPKDANILKGIAPIAGAGLLGAGMMRQEEQQPQQGILN